MSLQRCLMPDFSCIYVEKGIRHHFRTEEILKHFPGAEVIEINAYEDIFNRSRQSYLLQQKSRALILAEHRGQLVYQGSPVCQSFDQNYFYYTSSIMNCLYDCSYCWLKGLYQSAAVVIFVNLEDTFHEVEKMLEEHPVYLCVSYDTDLLGMESICHYVSAWCEFACMHDNLSIEIRSKGGVLPACLSVCERTILAVTVSPDRACRDYEPGAPSLEKRIALLQEGMKRGMPVRLCFDPVLVYPGWQKENEALLQRLNEEIDFSQVRDVSLGTFRLSASYMKKMRKEDPSSVILQYPYVCSDGFYHLEDEKEKETEETMLAMISQYIDKEKVFLWRSL